MFFFFKIGRTFITFCFVVSSHEERRLLCGYMVNMWLTLFLVCIYSDGCVEEDKSGVSKKTALSWGGGGTRKCPIKDLLLCARMREQEMKPMKDKGISALA